MPRALTSYYVAAFGVFSHSRGGLGKKPKGATKTAENIEDRHIINVALFGASEQVAAFARAPTRRA